LLAPRPQALGATFEVLGEPVHERSLRIRCVTRDSAGAYTAWGVQESADKFALAGIHLDSGKMEWVDTTSFGRGHIQVKAGTDGNLYIFTGLPGHFLRFDINTRQLSDLGVPAARATYWQGSAIGPDGKFYVGTYPGTELVRADPVTGKVENLGALTNKASELWAEDARTGAKAQILPAALTKAQGAPTVWLGIDGRVYGRVGTTEFLCKRDGIEIGIGTPAGKRVATPIAGDKQVGNIDGEGILTLTDRKTKEKTSLQTAYPGAGRTIFSVSCERDGRIYGGTVSPAVSFSYDTRTGEMANLGRLSTGPVQVYDTLSVSKGLFISSYLEASFDFFDPSKPLQKPKNPRWIATVAGQERPPQLIQGPDGMVYCGTVPAKGRLGGDLVRINPADFTDKIWSNVIRNQSVVRLASVPETGQIFCTSSTTGGSSAISTEREACVFLWDCKREAMAAILRPIPDAKSYGAVARARNGVIYGLSGNRYYALDPVRRRVLFTGRLPVRIPRYPGLCSAPAGRQGLIYGIGDGAIFAIDPADSSARIIARDPSLEKAFGFYATSDGALYYGSGARLMRCKLD
jgi:outer membrane protein assembly factor BamB